jgi:hypothetical protein
MQKRKRLFGERARWGASLYLQGTHGAGRYLQYLPKSLLEVPHVKYHPRGILLALARFNVALRHT